MTREYELYHLKFGQGEGMDLAAGCPNKLEEMKNILNEWQVETHANMVMENPGFELQKRYQWGKHPDSKQTRE